MEQTTYKINQSEFPAGSVCECGHTVVAHGSNGKICAACSCKQFRLPDEICSACGGSLAIIAGPDVTAVLCPVCDADSSAFQEEAA